MIRFHLARVIAVNAGLVLLVLVAAELVFGTWLFGPSFGSLNLPRDVERRYAVGHARDGGIVVYTRDRWALRGRYDSPANIGILALGGSTTNEVYVSDGETWTDRLGQRFAGAGRSVSVVNAGVEGQTTVGHLHNFDVWFPMIPNLKARYILAYVGLNDMALDPDGTSPDQTRYDRMESPQALRRVAQFAKNHSVFYRLWRIWRGMIRAEDNQLVHTSLDHASFAWTEASVPVADPRPESELARRLAGYRARLAALIARIRASGAEAIVVTQARSNWRHEGGKLLFARTPDGSPNVAGYAETLLFNRAALAACRTAGAICVDLAAEIEFRPGDFYDHVHTTPAGSARIADYLFEKLKDQVR